MAKEENETDATSEAESDGAEAEEDVQDNPDVTTTEENADEEDEELPALQIWHSHDVRIFPEQKAAEDRDKQRVLLAVWHVDDGRVVRIGAELAAQSELLEGWDHAVERVASPYGWGTMFGRPYRDVWSVDTDTGERSKVMERERYTWESAGGRYLLSFDGDDFWTVDLSSGDRANLTMGLGAVFSNQGYDRPTDRLPPYGIGGWLEEDDAVLLYSRYDVWRVAPDGSEDPSTREAHRRSGRGSAGTSWTVASSSTRPVDTAPCSGSLAGSVQPHRVGRFYVREDSPLGTLEHHRRGHRACGADADKPESCLPSSHLIWGWVGRTDHRRPREVALGPQPWLNKLASQSGTV